MTQLYCWGGRRPGWVGVEGTKFTSITAGGQAATPKVVMPRIQGACHSSAGWFTAHPGLHTNAAAEKPPRPPTQVTCWVPFPHSPPQTRQHILPVALSLGRQAPCGMASLLRPGAWHLAAGHSRMSVERVAGLGGEKGLKARVHRDCFWGTPGVWGCCCL